MAIIKIIINNKEHSLDADCPRPRVSLDLLKDMIGIEWFESVTCKYRHNSFKGELKGYGFIEVCDGLIFEIRKVGSQ